MEVFLIVMTILLVINLLFLSGSIVYTIGTKADGNTPIDMPRVSLSPSSIGWEGIPRRHSSHPQVMLYQNLVHKSITPHHEEQKKSFWKKFACGKHTQEQQ